jgi:ferritin-like metal-binding protein YciE
MPIADTQGLFLHELAEVYDAEHTFLLGQQAMVQGASDADLKGAIENHIEQTREHISNVEQVFENFGQEPQRETNEGAQALAKELREGLREAQSTELRDCVIVSAVIKVEHFEMGSYRALVTGAQLMGQTESEQLLSNNMNQEEETAQIAERSAAVLLQKAMQAESESSEEQGLIDKAKDKLTGQ